MDFLSVRIITDDVARLAGFYEKATGLTAVWSTPEFAEIRTRRATLALSSLGNIEPLVPGATAPSANRSVIIEFLVEDVDAIYANVSGLATEVVKQPTTMPWGNRSLLVRDADGNLLNFFAPVTAAAKEKFAH
ncbi:VOC family protein [Nocardia aurantiaca]|uniref:VOC family protein n=1 Tax=Nocardia aurantiaca TaxID=2675850 RepID=A0A6I3KYA5_9NOCA|nr:VOC family protein [Nocardia aurantiaca]MTE13375.1 VOC family protein [Nocardia aurantiaca]